MNSSRLMGVLATVLFSSGMVGCSSQLTFETPGDHFADVCKSRKWRRMDVDCGDKVRDTKFRGGKALVLFVEPGEYDYNGAVVGMGIMSGLPSELQPHFRVIVSNMMFAAMDRVFETGGSKYTQIYVARSQDMAKEKLLSSLKAALSRHDSVDAFFSAHGAPGRMITDRLGREQLTVQDLDTWAKRDLSYGERRRFRTLFTTLCYFSSGEWSYSEENGYSRGKSVMSGFTEQFPRLNTYGSYDINYGPLHRDVPAFQSYYAKGAVFVDAVEQGNHLLERQYIDDKGNVAPRHQIGGNPVTGRGCLVKWVLGSKVSLCGNRTYWTDAAWLYPSEISGSLGMYSGGREANPLQRF